MIDMEARCISIEWTDIQPTSYFPAPIMEQEASAHVEHCLVGRHLLL